ncbi:MAG: polysaccharide deacetylase family protein [Gammaproteobacteria bacterium]|nr:polysaccharide deacetylase family protein [Gammaproteobacteria bacterium]
MVEYLRNFAKDILQAFLPGRAFVWRVDPMQIGLTFDDGPDPEFTPKVLDALSGLGIKATFYFIGEKIQRYPDLVREVVLRGHAVGGHSFQHKELTQMSQGELLVDLQKTAALLESASGTVCKSFRPPRGRFNWTTLSVSRRAGFVMVHWSVTYSDYLRDGLDALRARLTQRPPRGGDVVLLHDNNPYTIAFLPDFVRAARAKGLEFVTLK